jgi:hypothetical protein
MITMGLKQYCTDCKQAIQVNFWGKAQGYDFEDGMRCQGCAQIHIKKVRGKL